METHTHNWLERTELLLGSEKLELLRNAHVLVVGLGGVGAYAAEMIARAGVGRMTVADADTVNATNINRQLVALHSTVGRPKAEVLAERLRDINPTLELHVVDKYIKDEETDLLLDESETQTPESDSRWSTNISRTRRPISYWTPRATTTWWTPSTPSRRNWR